MTNLRYYGPDILGSNNFLVILDGDEKSPFLKNVLWADQEKQVCALPVPVIEDGVKKLALGQDTRPFKIVDVRKGGEDKPSVMVLKKTHKGRAIVMGAGTSLIGDMSNVGRTDKDLLISVNWRPMKYYQADIAVFVDRWVGEVKEMARAKRVISIWGQYSDYLIDADETACWFFQSSPFLAMWLAHLMADEVVLCGFDLYTDGQYVDGAAVEAKERLGLELYGWKLASRYLDKDKIRAVSGPLTSIFGEAQ